jgi:alkanesulfonate monooxygenase SsuD/methylene tetrahydromethanopterin reductase-like flavin-dependent oxidoreductase (luciferase family)
MMGLRADVGLDAPTLVSVAQSAERAGFEGVFMIEHEYDSLMYDLAIALATERIRVGTVVTRMFSRHPIAMAEAAAAIAAFAPGRFTLAIGTGPEPVNVGGQRMHRWGISAAHPVEHMAEYIGILRAALRGESINHRGDWYRVLDTTLPDPCPDLPIYLAAGGSDLSRLAGSTADGAFFFFRDEKLIRKAAEEVAEGARSAGRRPEDVKLGSLILSCIADDRELAFATMRGYMIEMFLRRPFNQRLLASMGFEEVVERVMVELDKGDAAAAAAALPESAVNAVTVTGTPEEGRRRVEQFRAGGLDEPVLYVVPPDGDWLGAYKKTIEVFSPSQAS